MVQLFEPCAVIVGKPLANIGTIAKRGRLDAPGVFNTSYDILRHQLVELVINIWMIGSTVLECF